MAEFLEDNSNAYYTVAGTRAEPAPHSEQALISQLLAEVNLGHPPVL